MLFDKEFEFQGKHANYCRFLKDEINLFRTFREAYTVSAIVGFINSSKSERDVKKKDEEKVQPASVLPSELAQRRPALTYIYRLMMLLEPIPNGDIKQYQDRTFRDDADASKNPEKLAENMRLFNSYVLGGIEIIHERFKDCKSKKDTANTLYEFLTEFFEDNGFIDIDY